MAAAGYRFRCREAPAGVKSCRKQLPQDTDSGWDWLCILMRYGKPAEMLM